jgi:hypothetical protein
MALARVFRIHEAQTIEARAEAYNVLNSFRPGAINKNGFRLDAGRQLLQQS